MPEVVDRRHGLQAPAVGLDATGSVPVIGVMEVQEGRSASDMALTRDFKQTVAARVQSDPAFA